MRADTAVQTGQGNPRSAILSRIAIGLCCIAGALFLVRRMFVFDQYPTALSAVLPTLLCTFEALVLILIAVGVAFRSQRDADAGPA